MNTSELGVCLGLELGGPLCSAASLPPQLLVAAGAAPRPHVCPCGSAFLWSCLSLAGTGVFVLFLRTRRAALD